MLKPVLTSLKRGENVKSQQNMVFHIHCMTTFHSRTHPMKHSICGTDQTEQDVTGSPSPGRATTVALDSSQCVSEIQKANRQD